MLFVIGNFCMLASDKRYNSKWSITCKENDKFADFSAWSLHDSSPIGAAIRK